MKINMPQQPSKEEIREFIASPLFTAISDLDSAQTNLVMWWLAQPSKDDLKRAQEDAAHEMAASAVRAQARQGQMPANDAASKILAFIKAHPGCARRDILPATGVTEDQYTHGRKTLQERNLIRQEGQKAASKFYPV